MYALSPNRFYLRVALLLLMLAMACGCGGAGAAHIPVTNPVTPPNTPPTTPPSTSATSVSGNWQMALVAGASFNVSVQGTLEQFASSIQPSQLTFAGNACFTSGRTAGSVAHSNVTITVTADKNAAITLTGVLAADGNSINGSFQVAGGGCDAIQGTWTALRVQSIGGNWTNHLTSAGGAATTATGTFFPGPSLSQFSSVLQLSRCFPDPVGVLGTVSGTSIDYHGETVLIHFVGTMDVAATRVAGDYRIDQGPCSGEAGTFVMTRR